MSIKCDKCGKETDSKYEYCGHCGHKLVSENNIVFILDRSGSMHGQESATIDSYNEFLERHRHDKADTYVTTVLFDDRYELLRNHEKIENVDNLTSDEYYTRGCTALYDAIGKTIKEISHKAKGKVVFVITTDGFENASNEYDKKSVSQLIKEHENYEFIYIGANIDSYAEAQSIGIKKRNIANRSADSEGLATSFDAVDMFYSKMVNDEEIDESWKEDIK